LTTVADAERVQAAFDAAVSGDVEPLVSLMAPEMEWRGVERGRLWWRNAPR
jgi:ketosteroid isomerase-like protein